MKPWVPIAGSAQDQHKVFPQLQNEPAENTEPCTGFSPFILFGGVAHSIPTNILFSYDSQKNYKTLTHSQFVLRLMKAASLKNKTNRKKGKI